MNSTHKYRLVCSLQFELAAQMCYVQYVCGEIKELRSLHSCSHFLTFTDDLLHTVRLTWESRDGTPLTRDSYKKTLILWASLGWSMVLNPCILPYCCPILTNSPSSLSADVICTWPQSQHFAFFRRPSQHKVYNYIEELMVKTQGIKTVELEKLIGSNENNIFFIETNDDITKLHPRLLCAFESAAAYNPTMKVQIQHQRKS